MKKIIACFLVLLIIGFDTGTVLSLTNEQRRVIKSGIGLFDTQNECSTQVSLGTASVPIEGENPQRAFAYLKEQGLSNEQAAGVVGNLMLESSPNIDPTIVSPAGYRGIAQWGTSAASGNRWGDLVAWAQSQNRDPLEFATQLEFMWLEATDRGEIDGIKQYNDVPHATWYWGRFYEGAVINGSLSTTPLTNVQELEKRTQFAQQVYENFAGATSNLASSNTNPTVVALDPGHGGSVPEYIDEETGLVDRETTNSPEREDVLEVANRIKSQLEEVGYSVVLLRSSNEQQISKRERVDAAKSADASIAVSIHTTPGEINQVWPQHLGGYREKPDGSRVEFTNAAIASTSRTYSEAVASARTESEGHAVSVRDDVFEGGEHAPGNLTHVQLWSDDIPWVYNEIAQNTATDGITDQRKQQYADGIANGIIAAIPTSGVGRNSGSCGQVFNTAGLSNTVLTYAWPDYRAAPFPDKKPEYDAAIDAAMASGQYVGGGKYPGVDCGGWVTRLMIDSGFEPNYNYGGVIANGASNVNYGQSPWIEENWQRIGSVTSTAELQPGDVAINIGKTHTFAYVGDIQGFDSEIASASYSTGGQGWRAPMAGRENPLGSNIIWYRKR